MLRFFWSKVAKEEFYNAKIPIKIWDVNVNNIIISKLVETKNNFKYFIGYLYSYKTISFDIEYVMLRHLKLKMEIKVRTIN